ncbi:reverse transcriptase domain-containing protein [Nitrosomonas nitrosa]|uniref:reverse transcriptase domain-containing protein n=1 Tax=Nitrosomonas nitrosa TaxID=52442 RepID=UPI0030B83481
MRKWLTVGVVENGKCERNLRGAPQGAVISPLLANIYLHYVFDLWTHQWRSKKTKGDIIIARYADDSALGFQYKTDADRFLKDLEMRMKKFDLEIHPEKMKLIRFGRFAKAQYQELGEGKPDTFDFLGFTHYCTNTKNGKWFVVGRKTIKKRMRAQLLEIKRSLRERLHAPISETGAWLRRILTGHLNYYAVPENGASLKYFFNHVAWCWIRTLRRRSQRRCMTWERFGQL